MHDEQDDAERLAMLLDAKMSPAERERLLSELASNPEMLAILAGASEALGEADRSSATSHAPGKRSLVRRLRDAPVWLAAAAAIVVAVVFGVLQMLPDAPRADRVLALVEQIDPRRAPPDDWSDPPWGRTRGAGDASSQAVGSMLLGARAADLAFAREHGPDRTREIAAAMRDLASGMPGSGPAVTAWESAWQDMRDSARSEFIPRDAVRTLEPLADPDYFALGATLEGMRLAVLSADGDRLSSLAREFDAWTPSAQPSDSVRAAIAALSEALDEVRTPQSAERQLQAIDDVVRAVLQGPAGA